MIAPLRLAWRLQRWEFAFVVIGGLGLAAVAFWQAFDMRSMLTGCGTPSAAPACEFVYPFQTTHGTVVPLAQMLIGRAPFLAGLPAPTLAALRARHSPIGEPFALPLRTE